MAYLKHRLGKTYFESRGRGKGTPLIFLHGGPGGSCKRQQALFELGDDRKVYIYDQLGGGKSGITAQNLWNIETFVKELELLIDHWKLKEFHLGGGSWGTTLALEYYLRKKGKGVNSLIFQSPMFSADDWKQDGRRLISKLPAQTKKVIKLCHEIGATDSKVYGKAMMEFYVRHVLRDKKKLEKMMGAFTDRSKNSGKQIYEYMWGPSEFEPTGTLKTYNRTKDLSKIKVPTLFMCGEHDEATPKTTKHYASLVQGAEFVTLKGCSHVVLSENPKLVIKEIRKFL